MKTILSTLIAIAILTGNALGAITFDSLGNAGAVEVGTTTIPSLSYPTVAAGDLLVLVIANKPSTSTPDTPSGWTAATNYTNVSALGTEDTTEDGDNVRVTVFYLVAAGTESGNFTSNVPSGTSNCAFMLRYTKGAGTTWGVGMAKGTDNTAGTGYSAAMGSDPGLSAGDYAIGVIATNGNGTNQRMGSEAITATGCTFGTMNERADNGTNNGLDTSILSADWPVDTGPSSGNATITGTYVGGTPSGPGVLVRIREVSAGSPKAVRGHLSRMMGR